MVHIGRGLRIFVLVLIGIAAGLPVAGAEIVAFHAGASAIIVQPLVPFEHGVLTVAAPDGTVFRQEFGAGEKVVFSPFGRAGYQPPDGSYIWEVWLGRPSTVHPKLRAAARAARESGDVDVEVAHRVASAHATDVQSGAFQILGGTIVPSDLVEPGSARRGSRNRSAVPDALRLAEWLPDNPSIQPVDQVIADDLIVQGSACIGLDCVNNESFGFDTIRLKENNTRIKFDDTSTASGFPANDWQLTANDSNSGGSSKFSIEDITGSKVPFTITAGAATNSIFVDSTGRLGLRTATPVLDVHINTGNTPATRLEQNSSGGFTAQTWDVAGNEANFFVRDVTGGSRLPFRIRPGAPTSSIDISASGNVGVGTASPANPGLFAPVLAIGGANPAITLQGTRTYQIGENVNNDISFFDGTASAVRMVISSAGNVGIGTTTPAVQLHTTLGVRHAGVANCSSGIQSNASGDFSCLASTRQVKDVVGELEPQVALANVMALRPQVGSYKATPDVPEHWLIAEETAAVDLALVGLANGKPFTVKTQNVVADLIAVVQQQQRRIEDQQRFIEEQQRRLEALERAAVR